MENLSVDVEENAPFEITTCGAETVVLHIGEALDFRTASAFKVVCQDQFQAGKRRFVLDFSETRILDSSGLGAIFTLHRLANPAAGQVVFAVVTNPVKTVIHLTRLHRIFRQFSSVEAACRALDS